MNHAVHMEFTKRNKGIMLHGASNKMSEQLQASHQPRTSHVRRGRDFSRPHTG